jgi:hypothetical protein
LTQSPLQHDFFAARFAFDSVDRPAAMLCDMCAILARRQALRLTRCCQSLPMLNRVLAIARIRLSAEAEYLPNGFGHYGA